MNGFSAWILSIVGICLISILVDLMLPNGKTNKTVKQVVSYAIILVVIMPLPKLINKNITNDYFNGTSLNIQNDYIYNVNQSKLELLKKQIDNALSEKGFVGIEVSISGNIFENPMEINAIYVDLYNLVISNIDKNINIKTEVLNVILNLVDISKDKVVFYE